MKALLLYSGLQTLWLAAFIDRQTHLFRMLVEIVRVERFRNITANKSQETHYSQCLVRKFSKIYGARLGENAPDKTVARHQMN